MMFSIAKLFHLILLEEECDLIFRSLGEKTYNFLLISKHTEKNINFKI